MKTVSRTLQLFIAALVISVGLSVAALRVLIPNADHYRGDLETWLAGITGQPVAIGSLEAEWRGWRPEFRIKDLKLRDPTQLGKDGAVNAHFQSATISVDVLASLLSGQLQPREIRVGDVSLRINQAAEVIGPEAAFDQHMLALLEWLLSQDRLRLAATRVELSDLRVAGEPLTFTNLHLVVRNDGASHAIEAAVEIPGDQNGTIRANATIEGDPGSSDWSGDIAIHVDGLNVATLESWRYRLGKTDVAGRVSLNLDSRWQRGALIGANGDLSVSDMRIASAGGTLGPLDAEVLVNILGDDGDWRMRLLHPRAGFLNFRQPTPLATVRYTGGPSRPQATLSASIESLAIAHLLPVLPMALQASEDLWQRVADAAPSGQIQDLTIVLARGDDDVRDIRVAGGFKDVGNRGIGALPALTGVHGSFEYDARGTRVRIAKGSIRASLPELFPEPLTGTDLHGELSWSSNDTERRLTLDDVGFVTPDVTARASGELLWQNDDPVPFVDLSLDFSDGDLARIENFVPTSMFGEKTGAWLDQAFPRGHLRAGTVALHGRPSETLDAKSDFTVTVDVTVDDATVHYLDGWPSVEGVAGTVHIAERKLTAEIDEGVFFGSRLHPNSFSVADILAANPVFDWRTRIDGSTGDALRFLRESPLREQFRSLLDNVDADGPASLTLHLQVPLASGNPRIDGTIDLTGNTLSVPSLQEGFTNVAGRVRFDQDGMGGDGITGTYLGRTVTAGIETVGDGGGHTRVRLAGDADAAYVARHLYNAGLLDNPDGRSMPILSRLEGDAPWQAAIDVRERTHAGQAPVVLRVESSLHGAAVTLPAPFGKNAGASMALVVEARFADADHRQMRLTLGEWVSGIFDLRAGAAGYQLTQGAVRLGGGPATLPDRSELSVTGRILRADLKEWSALMLKLRKDPPANGALPTRIDLVVDRLATLGSEFADVHVQASDGPGGGWRASVSGPDVDGSLLIPADLLRQPIVARFEHLALIPIAGDETDTIDPRGLPPVHFTCERCAYGDMQFRDVEMITSRRGDGLSIDSLSLRTDGYEARANGAWTLDDAHGQRTRLDVQLTSDDLGKLLASLGHSGSATRGGVTDVSLAATWDGPPSQFDLGKLDGVLRFRAGRGILTDVPRGTTGRLFGLLVVPDLPRRLKGDFSDLFEDGFVYKQIEGTFNIEKGNAYTNDLSLDGSLARIDIAGRTGLADEDYDQLITVTPKLSDSLPLMPIWLVEKALRQELINKLFAYQYTITGSWDDPSVTRIIIEHEYPADRS